MTFEPGPVGGGGAGAGVGRLRALARRLGKSVLGRSMTECRDNELARSAVVFAPHPDDETLGCGGTILRKRRAGAEVRIVFMTDGSQSHSGLMAAAEMKAVRAREAVAAAQALGVDEGRAVLLGLPDGRLTEHEDAGVRQVAEVLRRDPPAEVFVPYYRDGPPDHHATTRIVNAALRECGQGATIYEYPVWFWHHWPWTPLQAGGRAMLRELRESAARGWRLWRDFRCCVRIDDVLDRKRAALARHASQVQRLLPDPSWLTLGDIAQGDFLACFFQGREIFYRHRPAPWQGPAPGKAADQVAAVPHG